MSTAHSERSARGALSTKKKARRGVAVAVVLVGGDLLVQKAVAALV